MFKDMGRFIDYGYELSSIRNDIDRTYNITLSKGRLCVLRTLSFDYIKNSYIEPDFMVQHIVKDLKKELDLLIFKHNNVYVRQVLTEKTK